jgi:hypothetical protein
VYYWEEEEEEKKTIFLRRKKPGDQKTEIPEGSNAEEITTKVRKMCNKKLTF